MRYLLTILALLALVSGAASDCVTTDQKLGARSEYGLPDSSAEFAPSGCTQADWSFEFVRTKGMYPSTIEILIDCMGLYRYYPSEIYEVRQKPYRFGGQNVAITDTSGGHLHIFGSDADNFIMMKLRVFDFE